jgi:uridine kinase
MMPLYLIAGVSGTGKSRLSHDWANQASRIAVVDLDDFYLAQSDPRLPHVHGDPDWESAESVDLRAATAAIDSLLCGQDTSVPIYDMSSNSIVGRRVIGASDIEAVVVHGVLAFDIFSHLASRTIRILLKCSTARVLWRRFYRDIDERRRGIWSSAVHSLRMATKDHAYNEANSAVADFIYESGIAPQKLREQVASDLEGFRYSDA